MRRRVPGSLRRSGVFLESPGVGRMRYCFYIDGFNVYYALRDGFQRYKWVNYRALAEQFIRSHDTIERVVYFSALTRWKQAQLQRHQTYIKALRSANVEIVHGRFKRKQVRCQAPGCGKLFWTREEKRTDVNIALQAVADASEDMYDRAVLVSADSDLLPVIATVHRIAPDKEVGVMIPIGRTNDDLVRSADFRLKMRERNLQASQFPTTITVGNTTITKPIAWP